MANSVDPDGTVHYEPPHLDLRSLQKPIIIACDSERVKINPRPAKPIILKTNWKFYHQKMKLFR